MQNTTPATFSPAPGNAQSGLYADSPSSKHAETESEAGQKANLLKKKVAGKNMEPGPFTSRAHNTEKDTVTGTEGYFDQPNDSAIAAIAPATRYSSKSTAVKKDPPLSNKISQQERRLQKVVVNGYGTRKKTNKTESLSDSLNRKVAGMKIVMNNLQPVGGREKFERYIQDNARTVCNAKGEPFTGEVLLSFTLDKKGRPENIRVLKSACAACEKQARLLLQNGPGWLGTKDTQGIVVIKF